jgi:hypothetical protein
MTVLLRQFSIALVSYDALQVPRRLSLSSSGSVNANCSSMEIPSGGKRARLFLNFTSTETATPLTAARNVVIELQATADDGKKSLRAVSN